MKEQWKEFADGYYEVSRSGGVRRAKPGKNTWAGRILKQSTSSRGYLFIKTHIKGDANMVYTHQLVAAVFIGPCPPGLEINHRDGVKTNNNANNLEYVTHKNNVWHAMRLGLTRVCPRVVYPNEVVSTIREFCDKGLSYRKVSSLTGVSESHVARIHKRKRRVMVWVQEGTPRAIIEPFQVAPPRHCRIPQSLVDNIRDMRSQGRLLCEIAAATGVSMSHISKIARETTRVPQKGSRCIERST